MTLTLKQSLPKDPRELVLHLPVELQWQVEKYLGHPVKALTLQQSLRGLDPRVLTLPLPDDLQWEIQKYLTHPVADIVKTDEARNRRAWKIREHRTDMYNELTIGNTHGHGFEDFYYTSHLGRNGSIAIFSKRYLRNELLGDHPQGSSDF